MKEAIKKFLRALIEYIDGVQISERQYEFAKVMGNVLDRQADHQRELEGQCNHRKGGMVGMFASRLSIREGLNHGMDIQYAVRKHQMMNGDIWVDCLRCGKKWRPPLAENFTRKNWLGFTVPDVAAFNVALAEYKAAVDFETRNTMSGSVQCRFADRKTGLRADRQITAMYAKIGG